MTADIENARIAMDTGVYTYEPMLPEMNEEEEKEFEAVEEEVLKRALKNSNFL